MGTGSTSIFFPSSAPPISCSFDSVSPYHWHSFLSHQLSACPLHYIHESSLWSSFFPPTWHLVIRHPLSNILSPNCSTWVVLLIYSLPLKCLTSLAPPISFFVSTIISKPYIIACLTFHPSAPPSIVLAHSLAALSLITLTSFFASQPVQVLYSLVSSLAYNSL